MSKTIYISKWEVLTEALIEQENKAKGRVWARLEVVPVKAVNFEISEKNLKDNWGRKWKKTLQNVVNLGLKAEEMSHIGECYREACISCTNPKLKKALGLNADRALLKAIDDAKEVGLLIMTDAEYHIGECGRKFVSNTPVLNQLITVLHNTTPNQTPTAPSPCIAPTSTSTSTSIPPIMLHYSQMEDNDIVDEDEDGLIDVEDWTFDHGYNSAIDDETVIKGIHKHYPWLRDYQHKVAELNKHLPALFQMQFNPSVKRNKSGHVGKVGIRCTSEFASTLSDGRKELLKKLWNVDEIYDYDVKSSIYRVTYSLNHGEWLPKDVDLYKEIMTAGKVPFRRSTFKALAMGLYFGKSAKQSLNWWTRKLRRWMQINVCDDDKAEYMTYWDAMRQVVGKTYSSEIFLHESCIYIDLLEELVKRGIRVGQVYDGFYSDRPIEELCEELLPVIAKRYAMTAGIQKEEKIGCVLHKC